MGTSPITINALTATPTLRGNKLKATVLNTGPSANIAALMLSTIVFKSSLVNDYSAAVEIARGNPEALDAGLVEEQTYYYWAYAIDNSGNTGAVFPVSPTGGVACKAIGMSGLALGLANGKLVATVAANALTIAIKTAADADPSAADPVFVAFRNPTLSVGNYSIIAITSALQLVISNGSTMGVGANALPFRLWVAIFNDGGTLKLGAINASAGLAGTIYPLSETANALFTAVDTGAGDADNIGNFYTNSTLTNKSFRVLGYLDWSTGLAAVGAWSVSPDSIRLLGQGAVLAGGIIQEVAQNITGYGGTNAPSFPYDDTKPQISEGIGTGSYGIIVQATSACNFWEVEIIVHVSLSAADLFSIALFKDSNVDAIAVASQYIATANQIHQVRIRYRFQTASVNSVSLTARYGTTGGATATYRGAGAASKFGGALSDFIRTVEIAG